MAHVRLSTVPPTMHVMSDNVASPAVTPGIIRTVVPLVVGWLVVQLAALGVDLDPTYQAQLASVLTVVVAGLYYSAVRYLGKRWPQLEWLLGYASQPVYPGEPLPPDVVEVLEASGDDLARLKEFDAAVQDRGVEVAVWLEDSEAARLSVERQLSAAGAQVLELQSALLEAEAEVVSLRRSNAALKGAATRRKAADK